MKGHKNVAGMYCVVAFLSGSNCIRYSINLYAESKYKYCIWVEIKNKYLHGDVKQKSLIKTT
jgi:hypothetical protein